MKIVKRPSRGRGEYELAGTSGQHHASALVGRRIYLDVDGVALDSGNQIRDLDGKIRIRIAGGLAGQVGQLTPSLAAYFLLPEPTRVDQKLYDGLPVIREKKYILDLEVGVNRVDDLDVIFFPERFIARSGAIHDDPVVEEINLKQRGKQINSLIRKIAAHGGDIDEELEADFLKWSQRRGGPDGLRDKTQASLVRRIIRSLYRIDDYYVPLSDPLGSLLRLAGLEQLEVEGLPDLSKVDGTPEVRHRVEKQYRLVAQRGAAARSFAKKVLLAYNGVCVICGEYLAGGPGVSSGIEAAHILPWSKFDLDEVRNGLALCKQHHWAFDSGLLSVLFDFDEELYVVAVGPLFSDDLDARVQEWVLRWVGEIPRSHLPVRSVDYPDPVLLLKLEEIRRGW